MSDMYAPFRAGEHPIRACQLPPDYLPEVQPKLEAQFGPVLINPNAWAVNPGDPRQTALTGLWQASVDIRNERLDSDGYPHYNASLLMSLRAAGKMTSLIFFGHPDFFDMPELEALRLDMIKDVNAHPRVVSSGLYLP